MALQVFLRRPSYHRRRLALAATLPAAGRRAGEATPREPALPVP